MSTTDGWLKLNFANGVVREKNVLSDAELLIFIFRSEKNMGLLIPMTMQTRRSKVNFPDYSEKKPAEDTLVPPLWGRR